MDFNRSFHIRPLGIFLALSFSTAINAQNLSIASDIINVSAEGPYNAAPTVNSSGLVAQITGVPRPNTGLNIPSFSYTLQQSGVANGTYVFTAGIVLDNDNSSRRLEIMIPGINMSFTGGVLTGSITTPTVTVLGRNFDGSIEITTGSFASNSVSFNGATISFNATN